VILTQVVIESREAISVSLASFDCGYFVDDQADSIAWNMMKRGRHLKPLNNGTSTLKLALIPSYHPRGPSWELIYEITLSLMHVRPTQINRILEKPIYMPHPDFHWKRERPIMFKGKNNAFRDLSECFMQLQIAELLVEQDMSLFILKFQFIHLLFHLKSIH
jgi:hypothetical protein